MSDNHSHTHSHSHEGHSHAHSHQSPEESVALLTYMIDHNKHHGEDLHEVYHALESAGKTAAAEALHKAMHLYEDANAELEEALKLL